MRGWWIAATLGLTIAAPARACLPALAQTPEEARESLKNGQQHLWSSADRVFLARIERIRYRAIGRNDFGTFDYERQMWLRPVTMIKGGPMPKAFTLKVNDYTICGSSPDPSRWQAGKGARLYLAYAVGDQPGSGYVMNLTPVDELIDPVALKAIQETKGTP